MPLALLCLLHIRPQHRKVPGSDYIGSTALLVKPGNLCCHVSPSRKRCCSVAQAVTHTRRPHTRQQSRRTGGCRTRRGGGASSTSVHRLQTRRLVPLLPALGSDLAVVPAEAALDILHDDPPPPREPTAEELAIAAKKRQIAELRQKLDQVLHREHVIYRLRSCCLFFELTIGSGYYHAKQYM